MATDSQEEPVSSDHPPQGDTTKQAGHTHTLNETIRRRPPVASQPKEVQERCVHRGDIFYQLEQMKAANGNKLPRGTLRWALAELDLSKARFVVLWEKQYEPYRRAFPDTDPAEAFSPYSTEGGRPRGRDIPPEVTRTIQQLYKARGFESLNYDGTINRSRLPILAKGILSGVQTLFPDHADIIKLYDVYAAIHDVWKREAANVYLARGHEAIIDANLPTRNSDVEGSDEQWQIDIRPLPGYVRYGDINCTVLSVVIADRWSSKIWAGRLIPGVKVKNGKETEEDVWSGDYKAQEIRDVIATAVWRANRCCRMLYPDNGSHFKKIVLGPYMIYLASESSDGSQVYQPHLVNRTPLQPRGGGFIENLLGNLDSWMRKFYGHHDEKVEDFRTLYRMVNKNVAKLPTFETVAKDFQGHIRYLNKEHRENKEDVTREERWNQGSDKSFPMPPLLNLALFARQVKKDTRKVQRYGFDYDSKQWEFEGDDPEIRSQWLNAALSPDKRDIIVMKIGRETIVLMNVSGDGKTYVRAIPKGKPRNTIQHDKKLNREARRIIEEENRADSEALEEKIRSHLAGGSLVIHPAGKKLIAKPGTPTVVTNEQQDTQTSDAHDQSTGFDTAEQPPVPLASDTVSVPLAGTSSTPTQAYDAPAGKGSAMQSSSEPETGAIQNAAPKSKKQRGKKGAKSTSPPEPQPTVTDDQHDEDDEWADFEGLGW